MKQMEVATLKKIINQEIDNENYEKVDELIQELCELQGFHMEGEMPEAFVFKLKQREKERRRMDIRRNIIGNLLERIYYSNFIPFHINICGRTRHASAR